MLLLLLLLLCVVVCVSVCFFKFFCQIAGVKVTPSIT